MATEEVWRTTTPIELTTVVERGGRVSTRLAGREVHHAQVVPGHPPHADNPRIFHEKVLDALAEAVKHAMDPELWEFNRRQRHRST